MTLLETIQVSRPKTTQTEVDQIITGYGKTEQEILDSEQYLQAVQQELELTQSGMVKAGNSKPNLAKKEVGGLTQTDTKVTLDARPIRQQVQESNVNQEQAVAGLAVAGPDAQTEAYNLTVQKFNQGAKDLIESQSTELAQIMLTKLGSEVSQTVDFTVDFWSQNGNSMRNQIAESLMN